MSDTRVFFLDDESDADDFCESLLGREIVAVATPEWTPGEFPFLVIGLDGDEQVTFRVTTTTELEPSMKVDRDVSGEVVGARVRNDAHGQTVILDFEDGDCELVTVAAPATAPTAFACLSAHMSA